MILKSIICLQHIHFHSLQFVVSSPLKDFEDKKIVLSHELFYHYQKYICGNGSYSDYPSGNFTVETTADQAAIQVVGVNKTGTAINNHAGSYIINGETIINQVGDGYGAFVFATNYATSMVRNDANYMFNSMKTIDTIKSNFYEHFLKLIHIIYCNAYAF